MGKRVVAEGLLLVDRGAVAAVQIDLDWCRIVRSDRGDMGAGERTYQTSWCRSRYLGDT